MAHDSMSVRNAAYRAIACFPPPDIQPYLQLPLEFVAAIKTDNQYCTGLAALLSSIVHHESVTMRRPIFKGLAAAEGVTVAAARDVQAEAQQNLLTSIRNLAIGLLETYKAGKLAGAMRSGVAVATLLSAQLAIRSDGSQSDVYSIAHADLGRTALKDIGVLDFATARFEAIDAWKSFWRTSFFETSRLIDARDVSSQATSDQPVAHEMVAALVKELIATRFDVGKAPTIVHNSICSAAGVILAAHDLAYANAVELAIMLVDHCFTELAETYVKPDLKAILLAALSSTTRIVHTSDDRRAKRIFEYFVTNIQSVDTADHEFQVPFTAGLGISRFLFDIMSSPGLISHTEAQSLFQQYVSLFSDTKLWNSGLGIGLHLLATSAVFGDIAEMLGTQSFIDIASTSIDRLSAFLNTGCKFSSASSAEKEMSSVVSAMWAVSGISQGVPEAVPIERHFALITDILATCKKDSRLQAFEPLVQLVHHRELWRLASISPADFASTVTEKAAEMLSIGLSAKYPATTRQNALISLRPLLGLNYTFEPEMRSLSLDLGRTHDVIRQLYPLMTSRDDPKIARISGWIVGTALESCEFTLNSESVFTSGRRDPRDYRRLNIDTSYLRALFDALKQSISENSKRANIL
eukprot:jgi/Hompol1/5192/HPOL_004212-RA